MSGPIRLATPADLAAITRIYAHAVCHGTASFEITPPDELEMARRYERCRIVVENSWQLGEWEKRPDVPGTDATALIQASMKALAAPI